MFVGIDYVICGSNSPYNTDTTEHGIQLHIIGPQIIAECKLVGVDI